MVYRSYYSIMIEQTTTLGSIGRSIEPSLGSIRVIHQDQLDDSINPMILSWLIGLVFRINCMLDRTFTMSSLIDRILSQSIRLMHYDWLDVGSIRVLHQDRLDDSIDPMIISWSIRLVLRINRTLNRTFTVSSLIDRTLSRSIRLMHYDWLGVRSIRVTHLDRLGLLSIQWSCYDRLLFEISYLIKFNS
jgi:hypothetical protein